MTDTTEALNFAVGAAMGAAVAALLVCIYWHRSSIAAGVAEWRADPTTGKLSHEWIKPRPPSVVEVPMHEVTP